MVVVSSVNELQFIRNTAKNSSIGLVPTMGALHAGHLSLVRRSIQENGMTIVSIYVNPTQFNDKNDFARYPRVVDADIELLSHVMREQDVIFCPSDEEMYPEPDTRKFVFGNIEKVMEGEHRPGHFNGVGQVVSKLFTITSPHRAYFGLKDFQQVAVVKELVRQMKIDIEIVSCPIVREADGLAMSSRNRLLEPTMRKIAPEIFKTISRAAKMFKHSEIAEIKQFVNETLNNTNLLKVEYFEIVDDINLTPLQTNADIIDSKNYYGCIAVVAGAIRLIDNIIFDTTSNLVQ